MNQIRNQEFGVIYLGQILKLLLFYAVIKYTERIILLKTATKHSCPFKSYVNLFNARVHELTPLVFKTFSTKMHYSVMKQMILTFNKYISYLKYYSINVFEILN